MITRGRVSQVGVLQEMDLGSIFGLLISVGFPKVSVSSHRTHIHIEDMLISALEVLYQLHTNHPVPMYSCPMRAVSCAR